MVGEENLSKDQARLNTRMMANLVKDAQVWWRETQPPLITVLPYSSTVKEIKGTYEQRRFGAATSNFGAQGLASLATPQPEVQMPTPSTTNPFPFLPAGMGLAIAANMAAIRASPAGAIATAAVKAPQTTLGQRVSSVIKEHPIATGLGLAGAGLVVGVGGTMLAQRLSGSSASGTRRRRINANNPKALRRALSRVSSYSRLNRTVEKSIKKAARLVS